MQNQRVVTKIEANPILSKQTNENSLLRVCAYCRVSTDHEDQLESYKAQVDYYTDYISKNPRWRLVDIYADEGITGTQVKKRDNFRRMIRDCEKGKIDLILTKSVARFARNTVDSLNHVRRLKAKGIGVYFEEQNLDSLKADSEMFIGIHSVLAQAESENMSANIKWGIHQRMKTGTYAFRYNILGYKKGEDGEPEIVQEEAEIVRNVFRMYLNGDSLEQIKNYLETNKVLTKNGNAIWQKSTIQHMLENEKYCGDVIWQKTYTENCITKKVKQNNGELAKYLIVNNHPAIIERELFKSVQNEISRRNSLRKNSSKAITEQGKYSGKYALTNILICGVCGNPYRIKTWQHKSVKKKVWRCLSRIENGRKYCKDSLSIENEVLRKSIGSALQGVVENQSDAYELILANLTYGVTNNKESLEVYAIENEIKNLSESINDCVVRIGTTGGDTQKYYDSIKKMNDEIIVLREKLLMAKEKMMSDEQVNLEVARIKEILDNNSELLNEVDDITIRRLIEYIRVMPDGKIMIVLKGGFKIEQDLTKKEL